MKTGQEFCIHYIYEEIMVMVRMFGRKFEETLRFRQQAIVESTKPLEFSRLEFNAQIYYLPHSRIVII